MFSIRQKREISKAIQDILRKTNHPELPQDEIKFKLHVAGREQGLWADIFHNGAIQNPGMNPHNEASDPLSQ